MYIAIICAILVADPVGKAAEIERVRPLIEKLAADSFQERKAAEKEIERLGSRAIPALRKGQRHPNAHVSDSCRRLLVTALDARIKEQIAAVQADPDAPIPDDLPGLRRWIRCAGVTKDSRETYREMLRNYADVLVTAERSPKEMVKDPALKNLSIRVFWMRHRKAMAQRGGTGPAESQSLLPHEMALLLYLACFSEPEVRRISPVLSETVLEWPLWKDALSGDKASASLQSLFLSWLAEYPDTDTLTLERGIKMARDAKLKGLSTVLRRMLAVKGAQPYYRTVVMFALFETEGRDCREALAKALDDTRTVSSIGTLDGRENRTIQVRDVALGLSVLLNGLRPADYGFEQFSADKFRVRPSSDHFVFASADKRDEAFRKWRQRSNSP